MTESRRAETNAGRKTFTWLVSIVAILLAAVLLTVVFGTWGRFEIARRLDIGYGASTNPRLVHFEIGDKTFAIPQNHIWSRENWKGGRTTGVNLQALLPNFDPYTEGNRAEFDKPGWNSKIAISLGEHSTSGHPSSMTREEVYARIIKGRRTSEESAPFALKRVLVEGWTSYEGGELYVGTARDGRFFYLQCGLDEPRRFPSCTTSAKYSEQVFVRYTFAKRLMGEWQTIDDGVFQWIRRFDAGKQQVQEREPSILNK